MRNGWAFTSGQPFNPDGDRSTIAEMPRKFFLILLQSRTTVG